jgi:cell division septum initiation protein DivIVA
VPDAQDRPRFVTVMRGYDRIEVDEYIGEMRRRMERLEADLAAAQGRVHDAEQRVETLEAERARSVPAAAPDAGFGVRAERLLRLAEQEAAQVRSGAAEEAASLRQQVREDVERQRHEAEQVLIARSAQFDEQVSKRTAELQQREQQVEEQRAAARAEAEAVESAARRAADQYRQRVEADAEETRTRVATEVSRIREQAEQELGRLTSVENGVRAELRRLSARLAQEVTRPGALDAERSAGGGSPVGGQDAPRPAPTPRHAVAGRPGGGDDAAAAQSGAGGRPAARSGAGGASEAGR